ncbi:MAG: leucine-rich repeat domain-containing protein [Oscillospiraceae bacterium]|nr:leucine-rich repeat domain-containing protein [Oscillospiraceae bacterium]
MFSKKKLAALALCGMLCISGMSMTAFAETGAETETTEAAETQETTEEAEEITSGEYTYRIDEEFGGAVITAYEPKEKNVTFPEKIDGVTVVGLGDFIFNNQSSIETVTIPKNICHIGASAFYGTGIKEFFVDAGHSMYKTEDGVLFSKDGIAIVAYPPKKQDTSYVIPDGVEEVYHGCFAGNTYLTELTLPDSLIYIDTWAFAYTIVQSLVIPDSVTEIGTYAFAYMTRLTDIKTPPELLNIPSAAFAGCSNLENVTLNEGLLEIGQGAFAGTAVRSIVIPPTVTNIGYCALGYDVNLTTSYNTLIIYGLSGSIAQTYATDKDEEYDYKNDFTFVAKTEAQLKEMLSSGDSTGEDESSAVESTEAKVIVEEESGSNSKFTWKVIIIVLGAAVLCVGFGAVAVSSKKNKKSGKDKKDSSEKNKESGEDKKD